MEIVDYLRIARRRLWILILVPLLAAGGAVALVLQSPPSYSATGYLSTAAIVGGPTNKYTGTKAASDFAAAFSAAAKSPPVLFAVARGSNLPVRDLSSGLTVTQNGESSDMTLTFTGADQQRVVPTLTAIKDATLESLFAQQVSQAKRQVAAAQAVVYTENQRLSRLTELYGRQDPRVTFQQSLRQTAIGALRAANIQYQAAKNQLSAAQSSRPWFLSPVRSVSPTTAMVRTVVPVVAAAIFLSVILVAMLELLANSRRRSREAGIETQAARRDRLRRAGGSPEAVTGK